jgi:hypothetical protein
MSHAAPTPSAADRNLLFGTLAVQLDFISRDSLVAALKAWALDKTRLLGRILVEQAALTPERLELLDALVAEHLKAHQNDPRQSLAAVSAASSVRQELRRLDDPDLQACLAVLGSGCTASAEAAGSRYRVLRPHAQGALGEVFVALDEELQREVALKAIQPRHANDPSSRSRFLLEAEITGGLEHPGVVPVYGLGQYADGRPFYAMRLLKGNNLKAAIRRFHEEDADGSDPGERAVVLRRLLGRFVDVCNAVAYAHSRGILHRDLKPGNILLGKYGETLIVDWGLARPVGQPKANRPEGEPPLQPRSAGGVAAAEPGAAGGTPAFMSPEQASGRTDLLGPASDIYSLGATLYCLLTGKPPFAGDDDGDVRARVQRGEFPPPRQVRRQVPPALEAIVLKAMALEPEARYRSPRDLADDVDQWLAGEPVTAYHEPLRAHLVRWGRRHPAWVAALALFLVADLIGGVWLKHEWDLRVAEAAERAAQKEQAVQAALEEIGRLVTQGKLAAARAALTGAEEGLVRGVSEDVRERLKQARADLDMVDRLEAVLQLASFTARKFENPEVDGAYAAAFAAYGLPASVPSETAAKQIAGSAIREQLIAALDDWVFVKPRGDAEGCERLIALLRQADPDAWRQQLRDPVMRQDRAALEKLARRPEALAQPAATLVHLGKYLAQAGAGTTAAKVLERAQQLHPDDFWANYSLATCLAQQNPPRLPEAVVYYRIAVALRPQSFFANYVLAQKLLTLRQTAAAATQLRRASPVAERNDPRGLRVTLRLGTTLLSLGRFDEALACYRQLRQVRGAQGPSQQLAELTSEAEKLAAAAKKLPAVLEGKAQPADTAERLLFARLCQYEYQRHFHRAARLFAEAFAAEPQRAAETVHFDRYNAACSAVLASTAQGEDARGLDDPERRRLRQQALDWLRADLAVWGARADGISGPARLEALDHLQHWQADSDFDGVRDAALENLPSEERASWQKLWADLEALVRRFQRAG